MANHNICNNLTYGLAFPNFRLHNKVTQPIIENTIEAGSLVESVSSAEIGVGVNIGRTGNNNKQEKPTPETRPGADVSNANMGTTHTVDEAVQGATGQLIDNATYQANVDATTDAFANLAR